MNVSLLTSERIRLALLDMDRDLPEILGWDRDTEYFRLLNSEPAYFRSPTAVRENVGRAMKSSYYFAIRTLAEDQLIGVIDVDSIDWLSGNCWLGVGIGPREFWGHGYGTEAMSIMVRYCFTVLNLKRVTLNVYQYNERALNCYLKTGFKIEGRLREFIHREGKRFDLIMMGILREDWEQLPHFNA